MSDASKQAWELQGFVNRHGAGRPSWAVGLTGDAAVIDYLLQVLHEPVDAFLLRRGAQVEVGGVPGPFRLIAADARERLARHLYEWNITRAGATPNWERQPEYARDYWRSAADTFLAAIAPEPQGS